MICKLGLPRSATGIFIGFAVIMALLVTSYELMKYNRQEEAPPLKYVTQTITNALGKDNDTFARDVITLMLNIEKQGYRVIHLVVDDEDGVMLRAISTT